MNATAPSPRPRFGTDGVRGTAFTDLTVDHVRDLGRAAVEVLGAGRWIVGRDTRESGPELEAALVAGMSAAGAEVASLGVCPTPAVAWVAARDGLRGAMISASHNPWYDNGVKLFSAGGLKLTDADQDRVQAVLDAAATEPHDGATERVAVADASREVAAYGRWVASTIEGRRLDGLRLVIDCANGANSAVAPVVLRDLGADVTVLHAEPNGRNINDGCGSTHLDDVIAAVRATGADLGLAFDGDADRVLAVDAAGELVDGDQVIAVCAIDRHERGELRDDTVVVTVMTNLGFRIGMDQRGIEVVETPVGDRYVLEALDRGGFALGGEQSGHVIFRDLATTGDGLLTAVHLLDVLARARRPLAALAAAAMVRLPQVLVNVRLDPARLPAAQAALADHAQAAEAGLAGRGRVLVRPSGTEPLLRIMVEAPTHDEAQAVAEHLAELTRAAG